MTMFAKLFGPETDQVLVKLDAAPDSGAPEIRIYFQPPGLGVCSFALGFDDTEDGWDKAEAAFQKMDEDEARLGIKAACRSMHFDFDALSSATQGR
jgi:hypothetical protein